MFMRHTWSRAMPQCGGSLFFHPSPKQHKMRQSEKSPPCVKQPKHSPWVVVYITLSWQVVASRGCTINGGGAGGPAVRREAREILLEFWSLPPFEGGWSRDGLARPTPPSLPMHSFMLTMLKIRSHRCLLRLLAGQMHPKIGESRRFRQEAWQASLKGRVKRQLFSFFSRHLCAADRN